jgi:uncharacterized protein (DUF2141 family)
VGLIALEPAAARAEEPRIEVTVTQLRSQKGSVVCTIWSSEAGFPDQPQRAVKSVIVPIRDGAAVCSFARAAPGTYAVGVFHDENGNGRLDRGPFGIPKEGVAVSNDARGHMGPAKWDDAKFVYAGDVLKLRIRVVY